VLSLKHGTSARVLSVPFVRLHTYTFAPLAARMAPPSGRLFHDEFGSPR
jgi:hypothetical protein